MENAVLPPALSSHVCPEKLLFGMSPCDGIEPFWGLDRTARICDKGRLLYAWYLASEVKLLAGEVSFKTEELLKYELEYPKLEVPLAPFMRRTQCPPPQVVPVFITTKTSLAVPFTLSQYTPFSVVPYKLAIS
jgi:hypothetical protein